MATKFMLGLVLAVTIFHLCILIKLIPYEITWGGRLKDDNEMYVYESISTLLNLILGMAILLKGNYVKQFVSLKAVNIILWFFFGLFALNTIGNIMAETYFEKSFTILTLLSCILLWIILKSKNTDQSIA